MIVLWHLLLAACASHNQRQYFMLPSWRRDYGLPRREPLLLDITTGHTLHPIIPTTIEPTEDTI